MTTTFGAGAVDVDVPVVAPVAVANQGCCVPDSKLGTLVLEVPNREPYISDSSPPSTLSVSSGMWIGRNSTGEPARSRDLQLLELEGLGDEEILDTLPFFELMNLNGKLESEMLLEVG